MSFQTERLNENEGRTVMLDNQQVSIQDFNKKLENLKKNQRIVESSSENFHVVERFFD